MEKIKEFLKKYKKNIIIVVVLLAAIGGGSAIVELSKEEKSYNEFIEMVEKDKVEIVRIDLDEPTFEFETKEGVFKTDNPKGDDFKKDLLESDVNIEEIDSVSFFSSPVVGTILQIGLMVWLLNFLSKSMGQKGNVDKFLEGDGIPEIDFDDVAGQEEAKEEMSYLVDFLKNPDKYTEKGASLPKGAIFYGPPGTGKTLLARAIAGEADVPFFSVNGSDFMEMYVGVGAKRVRALFDEAKLKAPSIIFIDEIDSVGGKRGSGTQHSEQQQTINALLNEMDGFTAGEGTIVIAATNRMKDLDDALIRPGRFDKHIAISLPDKTDREKVLKLHSKNKEIADDVDLAEWAKMTTGFAGSDLEALMNEAAILSVINDHDAITYEDMDNAHYKHVMKGHKKKNQKERLEEELKVVAWHEAGHALTAKLVQKSEVSKVTILSSTNGAGGVTLITPDTNPLPSKKDVENRIKTLYSGRIAEYLLLNDENAITAGASSDIEEATKIIRAMITDYGMSQAAGMLNLTVLSNGEPDDQLILNEARKISERLYDEALEFLVEHKDILEEIAKALVKKETLTEAELDSILNKFA